MWTDFIRAHVSYWIRARLAPFAGAFPINDAASRSIAPIMIVGCGRSGNTLLRSMLVRGGDVTIPPESYVWPTIARGYSRWRYGSWETVTAKVVEAFGESDFDLSTSDIALMKTKAADLAVEGRSLAAILNLIYETYRDLNALSGRRWGDKTPLNILHIGVLENIFPAAQYIHIVRDPRAVALSYVKAARVSPRIRERNFADAARRWNRSVHNARALARRVGGERFQEVKYEDLVCSPEQELRRLCQFLSLSYAPAMLSFYEGADMLGDVPAQLHHAQVQKPLDPSRSDSWRSQISPADRRTVETITSRYRKQFRYE